jgi:hypothetical protein
MAAINWTKVRGYEFTGDEAREASDFGEVLDNLGLDPIEAYEMFKEDGDLTVAKRLVFAEKIPFEQATVLLLLDPDERVRGVVDERLKEEREKENGGIIVSA